MVGLLVPFTGCMDRGEQRAIPMVDPDFALVDATGRGDLDAFESLVKRYQSPLLNFIFRYLGDRSAAEDLTQEVFLRIYRAAPRFQAKAKVATWIFRIAYHLALNELQRRRRHEDLHQALQGSGDEAAREPLTDPVERYELAEEMTSALGRLPANQRAALLLRVNQELSYREIGEVLGLGVPSVESLLFRARSELRRSMGRKTKQGVKA